MRSRCFHYFLLAALLFGSFSAAAQQEEELLQDELLKFHLFGLSFGRESRILEENYLSDAREARSDRDFIGASYTSLIGSRLGYYSDLYAQVPLDFVSQSGFALDYTGGVGWNVWYKQWGILPGVGFHVGYTSLKADDFADREDSFYLSFGLGAGVRILYRLTDSLLLYLGGAGSYDTQEFSSNPEYRDRKNSFHRAFEYKGSLGIGMEL